MTVEFLRKEPLGLVFSRGNKLVSLAMKVRVVGTKGLVGYGLIKSIVLEHGSQFINIVWASHEGYSLKPGDKVKFTKE